MRMETKCLVSSKTIEAAERIFNLWDYKYGELIDCSFEYDDVSVLDVMAKVIKLVHQMESSGQKDEFVIFGKCDTDYDCTIFSIEYSGDDPMVKSLRADPEEDERRYYKFYDAEHKKIPKLLKNEYYRTFRQAIKEDLPLGGFITVGYDKWVKSILAT